MSAVTRRALCQLRRFLLHGKPRPIRARKVPDQNSPRQGQVKGCSSPVPHRPTAPSRVVDPATGRGRLEGGLERRLGGVTPPSRGAERRGPWGAEDKGSKA